MRAERHQEAAMNKPTTVFPALLLLLLTTPVLASPFDTPAATQEERSAVTLEQPVELTWSRPAFDLAQDVPAVGRAPSPWVSATRLSHRLPAQAPQGLQLRFEASPVVGFYVTADLDDEALPRLDAVDGDTYFTVGLDLRLTRWLTVFLEDFQPASGVIGSGVDPEEEPVHDYSWDGHQVAVGARWQINARVALKAELRALVMSQSDKQSGVGGAGFLTVSF
jgi:hypothetical protein